MLSFSAYNLFSKPFAEDINPPGSLKVYQLEGHFTALKGQNVELRPGFILNMSEEIYRQDIYIQTILFKWGIIGLNRRSYGFDNQRDQIDWHLALGVQVKDYGQVMIRTLSLEGNVSAQPERNYPLEIMAKVTLKNKRNAIRVQPLNE